MSDPILPALTPEEWAYFLGPDYAGHLPQPHHQIAAMLLHGQPFGFTWEMVAALIEVIDAADAEYDETAASRLARSAVDRIAALLPPTICGANMNLALRDSAIEERRLFAELEEHIAYFETLAWDNPGQESVIRNTAAGMRGRLQLLQGLRRDSEVGPIELEAVVAAQTGTPKVEPPREDGT